MSESTSGRLRVAMFLYGDLTHDSRVLREAAVLAEAGYRVTVVARPAETTARAGTTDRRDGFDVVTVPIPGGWRRPWRILGAPVRFIAQMVDRAWPGHRVLETLTWLVIRRFAAVGWARAAIRAAAVTDIVHGHDLIGLEAAIGAARLTGARVVYDSHEVAIESGGSARRPAWVRRRTAIHEQGLIDGCSAVVTVNDAVLEELGRRYRLPALSVAVHNCPPRWEPSAQPDDRLRRAVGCPPGVRLAVYHGAFSPGRGLYELASALLEPSLEAVHGVYLGFGRERVGLERLAADPRFGGRIHVLDPVSPEDLVPWLSGADVAVMAIQPDSLNHLLSTPNKLFESIAAGVPVVSSDFPARRAIIAGDPDGPLGELCDPADPASVAAAIERITSLDAERRADLRRRCLLAARERWNWETEGSRLVSLYLRLAGVDG